MDVSFKISSFLLLHISAARVNIHGQEERGSKLEVVIFSENLFLREEMTVTSHFIMIFLPRNKETKGINAFYVSFAKNLFFIVYSAF